ncbi:SUMO-activating enzyme subunit 2 [Nilaparvata lugens]|uniref:SUMO-activating enzyme subunit 2 n=1 Tax=Nilaparvata lugens TaxID=108931 RepID=UPI00193DBB12|nr:SUMO-activating enzyme subunit 2 [Nilaparvata lugens]
MATAAGLLGENLYKNVNDSKILVVGAGGIGCEILKNLVLTGFKNIYIIDLDTIDVSNLNRQFLFHKKHVGKSKAKVALESALQFNPNVSITAYHDSIISAEYEVNFFKQFNLVLNALDNRVARNHVNRLCLASGTPLVESGTAGYEGQVELIVKGKTKCYECSPKAPQKTFPGCTIRNTPSEPIHCIVWSKYLFNQLFGEEDGDEEVSPDTADPEATANAGASAMDSDANEKGNVDRTSTRSWAQSNDYDPKKVFTKLFHDDIKYLLSLKDLWEERRQPTPLDWSSIPDSDAESSSSAANNGHSAGQGLKDQQVWSLKECVDIFSESCRNLSAQFKYKRILFAAMAGNIIPAIATTNAIVAGLVVMFALKVLQQQLEKCQCVYVRSKPNHKLQQIVAEKYLSPPNPKCAVCSPKPEVTVLLDVNKLTVKDLVEEVLKKSLNMVAPDAILMPSGSIIISSDEEEMDSSRLQLTLSACKIIDGSILEVDDFLQNYNLTVNIKHREPGRDDPLFEVVADPDLLKPTEEAESDCKNGGEAKEYEDSDDDLVMTVDEEQLVISGSSAAKRKVDQDVSVPVKKRRTGNSSEMLASSVQDDDDIAIVE